MNNPFTTHGMISWSELMTTDPLAAREFYAQLFDWTFETSSMPDGEYHEVSVAGDKVAGIMATPEQAKGTPPTWSQYVTVKDIAAVVTKVPELAGQIIVPETDIPGVGCFAVIQDPQGAVISVIQYAQEQA